MKKVMPLVIAISLTACGGGDGTSTNLLRIDADNAEALARNIYNAFDAFGNIDSILLGVDIPENGQTEYPCDQGDIVITANLGLDNIPNEAGEYIDAEFNNCVDESTSETFNGNVKLTLDSWASEDNQSISLDFDLDYTFDNFRDSGSGSFDITILGSSVELTANMDYTSGELGGMVKISTGTPIRYEINDFYPSTGDITATGAEGSYLTLDADTGDIDTVYYYVTDGASYVDSDVIDWIALD